MDERAGIDAILVELLRHREVLGAVALSREGLVVGSAGIGRADAELAGALGASLVGAAERTARRLGTGHAEQLCLHTADGMLHLRSGGDFAVLLLTERCDGLAAADLCAATIREIGALLDVRG